MEKERELSFLIEQFVNVTGADKERASSLLNICNGNLDMAIGMHLEDGGSPQNCSKGETTSHQNIGENEVRAPIPQKRGVLVDGPFNFKRGGNRGVFDAFRDFQAEAKEQEKLLSGNMTSTKRKTLEDLFKPPLDIIHKGTFDSAKLAGEKDRKWLIVNIQDSTEFRCQMLNRDVWSNSSVRNIIAEHFILWQVYHDSDDGDRYVQFYHVTKYPHLGVLDPRTGERLVEWDTVDAQSFCEVATEFLLNHSFGKESIGCLPPPRKRQKTDNTESIIDASEESQLRAAIAASLQDISTETTNYNDKSDKVSDKLHDEDDDNLTEFTASESDSEQAATDTEESYIMGEKAGKENTSKSSFGNFDSKDISHNNNQRMADDVGCKQNHVSIGKTFSEIKSSQQESNFFESNEDHNDENVFEKTQIMLRYPDGKREQKAFHAGAPLLNLIKYVQSQSYSNERFELVTSFPRRKLSYMDHNLSLKEVGLFPRETVFVQERYHDSPT